jgi:asparagine synthase (glutamine-hydrolysing)
MSFEVQAIVPFAIPDIIEYSLKIPPKFKIQNGVEKWILRQAFEDVLPEEIFKREKAKFWEGSGIKTLISEYANSKISDFEFYNNRITKSRFTLRTKEEYLYYKIFSEQFVEIENVEWLGFSKMESN